MLLPWQGISYISDSKSVSKAKYTYYRCCKFVLNGFDCQGLTFGAQVNDFDDGKKTSGCSGTYGYLLGCSVMSDQSAFDGVYPGLTQPDFNTIIPGDDYSYPQYCVAQHGSNIPNTITTGNRQCCKSPSNDFNCVVRYSDESMDIGGIPIAQVSCGTGYTMMGCSGWGYYNTLNGYFIANDDTCYAQSYTHTYPVYAIAVCCKMGTDSPTPAPAPAPSDQPTDAPTIEPTPEPTVSPTYSPSSAPVHPTVSPIPTATQTPTEPTAMPTNEPTIACLGCKGSGQAENGADCYNLVHGNVYAC